MTLWFLALAAERVCIDTVNVGCLWRFTSCQPGTSPTRLRTSSPKGGEVILDELPMSHCDLTTS